MGGRRSGDVALTETNGRIARAEIREMGVGDPTLGKQVRELVGAVAGRVERWRALLGSDADPGRTKFNGACTSTSWPVPRR